MAPEAAATHSSESKTNITTDLMPDADEHRAPIALVDALAKLVAILPRLVDALTKSDSRHRTEPLALRLDELAFALGVSRRAIERERSAGHFPEPDLHIGRMPLWRVETVRRWLERGGCP
jgi:hypothetical protein